MGRWIAFVRQTTSFKLSVWPPVPASALLCKLDIQSAVKTRGISWRAGRSCAEQKNLSCRHAGYEAEHDALLFESL